MKTTPQEITDTKDEKITPETPENSDQKWREEDKGRHLWAKFHK